MSHVDKFFYEKRNDYGFNLDDEWEFYDEYSDEDTLEKYMDRDDLEEEEWREDFWDDDSI